MEYIVLLFCITSVIGTWLILRKQSVMNKNFTKFLNEKQIETLALCKEMENVNDQFFEFILETKHYIEADKKELAKLFDEIKCTLSLVNKDTDSYGFDENPTSPKSSARNQKRIMAEDMIQQGNDLTSIAKELQLGIGEVQLIASFLEKSNT